MVQLFRGTVFDNLTLGDVSVSRDAVQRAAAIAGADAFIQALPQGYDTLLGRGMQLSAGQRQLLALTRALVWDPAVLLLDEATAAVDSASEAAVRAAIREAVIGSGRAVLTVAHRLATAQDADRVLVMEAGQIVEEGPPEELIAEEDGLLHCWSWKPPVGTGRGMGNPSGHKSKSGVRSPPHPR